MRPGHDRAVHAPESTVGPGKHWLWFVPSLCAMTLLTQPCPAEEMTRAEISA